jgi:ethanolaminephosphotransferase
LPRIKSLVAGSIPSFLDFLLNFETKQLKEDSIIQQFQNQGKKINFFGDDTWQKLFPSSFQRQEGVSSFFVQDTVEVDKNVSSHLNFEMKQNDWDVLILHYLGLGMLIILKKKNESCYLSELMNDENKMKERRKMKKRTKKKKI